MFLVILGLLYIIFSILNRKKYNPNWGLLIILFVMGLQASVPGDYDRYEATYNEIANNLLNFKESRIEPGWLYLNYIFSRFVPFQIFVFFLSLFEYCVLVKFIRYYTDKRFIFLSGLIFYFSINMMLFQMKGLRQGLSIEICLLALISVNKCTGIKKLLLPILLVMLASTFHTSSFLMMPVIVAAILLKDNKWFLKKKTNPDFKFPIIITAFYIFVFIKKAQLIEANKLLLLTLNLNGYEGYFGELVDVEYHILITIYGAIVVFAVSFLIQGITGYKKLLSLVVLISLFMEMLTFGAGNLFRLTLYYGIISIVVLPNISSYLYEKKHHILAWLFSGLVISYNFRAFITQTIRHSEDGFDNYTFIFLKLLE